MAAGKRVKQIWIAVVLFVVIGISTPAYVLYSWVYRPSVTALPQDQDYLYIPTGSDYEQLLAQFDSLGWLKNVKAFDWVAQKKNLPDHVNPGKYSLYQGMNNDSLVNLIRLGQQTEVTLTFKTMRTFEYLAEVVAAQIEADSADVIQVLQDETIMQSYGFSKESWFGMFIPNTYHFFWNTTARGFLDRMHKEYQRFWNDSRQAKLAAMGMDQNELIALASIVQEETFKVDEMPIVAGVYINRLGKGIRLQADPTVIFALGDPEIRRVLRKHLKVDSPYNTYLNSGLPPGPIRIPSTQAIDACLNFEHHNYLYFCAKEDFSGYHNFASSYAQHLRNARKYQRVLNERNIN